MIQKVSDKFLGFDHFQLGALYIVNWYRKKCSKRSEQDKSVPHTTTYTLNEATFTPSLYAHDRMKRSLEFESCNLFGTDQCIGGDNYSYLLHIDCLEYKPGKYLLPASGRRA